MSNTAYTWQNTTLNDYLYVHGNIPKGWEDFFNAVKTKTAIAEISKSLEGALKQTKTLDPPLHKVFNAFELSPLDHSKVVIIGQDPAPELGLAQGISFSIPSGVSTSKVPSIQRILLEAQNEGIDVDIFDGNLTPWAKEGVLLLNETLTISCGEKECTPDSNLPYWAPFLPLLIDFLNVYNKPLVYILWGEKAQQNVPLIKGSNHKILKGGHPSPEANGKYFFCGRYFLDANDFLKENGLDTIDWTLSDKKKKDYGAWVWGWDSEKEASYEQEKCTGSDR
ncbi:MAG: uracil-DNA glycosylase [bacterium]|nr:uracil-DNA glycosylase [bacterium]